MFLSLHLDSLVNKSLRDLYHNYTFFTDKMDGIWSFPEVQVHSLQNFAPVTYFLHTNMNAAWKETSVFL